MSPDRWENAFCWYVQGTPGSIDPARVPDIVAKWLVECFSEADRPRVRILHATADGPPEILDNHRESVGGPLPHIDDHAAFAARIFVWFDGIDVRDPREILLVVAENTLALNYSHAFGDEATMYPVTRRLWLELAGRNPNEAPPLVSSRRRVGTSNVLAAGAHLAITRPRETVASVRRLSTPDATGRIVREQRALATPDVDPTPEEGWLVFARVASPGGGTGKLPSVLFFTHLLAQMNLPAEVQHSILTDLRPYSTVLAGRWGNAIGPVSFRADWSVDDPGEVAAGLSRRVRSGESLIRTAVGILAARVLAARARLRRGPDAGPVVRSLPSTSFSHVRLPAGQGTLDADGEHPRMMGMINPAPNRLTINTREVAGRTDMTLAYVGSDITADQILVALKSVESILDTHLIAVDTAPLRPAGTDSGVVE